jgi:hypothetical protein
MKKPFLLLTAVLAAAALAYPQKVAFKLTGGLCWIDGGDLNKGLLGESDFIKANSRTTTGALEALNDGAFGQLEIITLLSPRFGIGLAGGYGRVSRISQISSHFAQGDIVSDNVTGYNARVSVIPFSINFHYFLPLTKTLKLDLFAGPLFAIVQLNVANPFTATLNSVKRLTTFTASQTTGGGQAGCGLSWGLSRGIELVADGYYRFATVSELLGNWAQSGTSLPGPVTGSSSEYYLWAFASAQSGTFQRIGFFDKNGPTDPTVTQIRQAKISLSGLILSGGLKISF